MNRSMPWIVYANGCTTLIVGIAFDDPAILLCGVVLVFAWVLMLMERAP